MGWNRTHQLPAQIIPFPLERARKAKSLPEQDGKNGKILFFTGVRYERLDETAQAWRADDHLPPRRGGSRS